MLQFVKPACTPDEYLAQEAKSLERHEYLDGEMRLMAGGSRNHSLILNNLSRALGPIVDEGPCEVHTSDLRLEVAADGAYVYPDVMVICDQPIYAAGRDDTVTNPIIIIEVLSPSTREHDRTEKFTLYQQLPSLQEYLLVDSTRVHVTHLRRMSNTNQWVIAMVYGLDSSLTLESIDCTLSLRRIYHKVTLTVES
jgi:Uma2 family endonuclease